MQTPWEGGGASCFAQLEMNSEVQALWAGQAAWLRSYAVSAVDKLGDLQAVGSGLARPFDLFEGRMARLYGRAVAGQLRIYWQRQQQLTARVIDALKAGGPAQIKHWRRQWQQGAEALSALLVRLNPIWRSGQWQAMLDDQLQTLEELTAKRIAGQYEQSLSLYELMDQQARQMADYMYLGFGPPPPAR